MSVIISVFQGLWSLGQDFRFRWKSFGVDLVRSLGSTVNRSMRALTNEGFLDPLGLRVHFLIAALREIRRCVGDL